MECGRTTPTAQLENVFQSNIWPGQYYNTLAQVSTSAPTNLSSLDATGKIGSVRFFASGSVHRQRGRHQAASRVQQNARSREPRLRRPQQPPASRSARCTTRTTIDQRATDFGLFGSLLRGAPAGTNYLARDTLGRPILQGGGSGIRGTGNGAGGVPVSLLENVDRHVGRRRGSSARSPRPTSRLTGSRSTARSPTTSGRVYNNFDEAKGFRTITTSRVARTSAR